MSEEPQVAARRAAILEQVGPFGNHTTWGSLAVGHRAIEKAIADDAGRPINSESVQLLTSTVLLIIPQAAMEWYSAGATGDLAMVGEGKLSALRSREGRAGSIRAPGTADLREHHPTSTGTQGGTAHRPLELALACAEHAPMSSRHPQASIAFVVQAPDVACRG